LFVFRPIGRVMGGFDTSLDDIVVAL